MADYITLPCTPLLFSRPSVLQLQQAELGPTKREILGYLEKLYRPDALPVA